MSNPMEPKTGGYTIRFQCECVVTERRGIYFEEPFWRCASCNAPVEVIEQPVTDRKTLADKTHEGFEITCKKCGSATVMVDSDFGYSRLSGMWGGVQLKCADCPAETKIWTPN